MDFVGKKGDRSEQITEGTMRFLAKSVGLQFIYHTPKDIAIEKKFNIIHHTREDIAIEFRLLFQLPCPLGRGFRKKTPMALAKILSIYIYDLMNQKYMRLSAAENLPIMGLIC